MSEKQLIVLVGAPGSGKGTQARILSENMGLEHLSTGDMIRSEVAAKSKIGKIIAKTMFDNGFISDDLAIKLVEGKITGKTNSNGFLLDGFPRTLVQAEKFEKMLEDNKQELNKVIEIQVDENVIKERVSGRYACKNCGAGYHDKFIKPKVNGVCDICKSVEFVRRKDDDASNIENRLNDYKRLTYPVVDFFKEKGKLYSVDGVGATNDVAYRISKVFEI